MRMYNHIIRSQQVYINYTGKEDAFVLQQQASDVGKKMIGRITEKLLAEYETTDETISIGKLEIGIDIDEQEDWLNIAGKKIEQQLRLQLQSKINSAKKGVDIKKSNEAFFETLVYYLQHGFLSWNASVSNKEQFETMLGKWIASVSPNEMAMLTDALSRQQAVQRLVSTVSNKNFVLLARLLSKNILSNETLDDILLLTKQIAKQKTASAKLSLNLKQQLVTLLLENNNSQDFYKKLVEFFSHYGQPQQFFFDKTVVLDIKTAAIKRVVQELNNESSSVGKARAQLNNEAAEKKYLDDTVAETKEITEGIFISNAGAVIIAPFLTRLFQNTGLYKEGKITDEEKTLCLVHYCITGANDAAEFELLLPKILCGVPVQQAVSVLVELNDEIINEADEMLASVIEHWNVLKNTSVDGLRQAFLQRNGKISFSNDKWLLQVEQKAHDVLLQQLPWSFSMVQLPWMKEILHTEWIY